MWPVVGPLNSKAEEQSCAGCFVRLAERFLSPCELSCCCRLPGACAACTSVASYMPSNSHCLFLMRLLQGCT